MTDPSLPKDVKFSRCCDDSGEPIIQPLDDLEALLGWAPDVDQACVCQTPLRIPHSAPSGPQTLLCHDHCGGYLEDRYPQGVRALASGCYRFYHWYLVDTFVYFSHRFITIPPPGWVAAAHRHGVRVLGTLITEWEHGAELMRAVLKSEASVRLVVKQMTAIARYYNFDGWLINIENEIESGDLDLLLEFVSALTKATHSAIPNGQVIWYDSVTNTGKLEWQNALNDFNSQYFDVCDGIFLNYTWKDDDLSGSRSLAMEKGRPWDVYVGVDVFGRGCRGDGGFNTAEAVSVARTHQLSVALFAPAWTFECLPKEDFRVNENRFWQLLTEFLTTRSVTHLPLSSSFCHGFGDAFFCKGEKVSCFHWFNLSLQSSQPNVMWKNKGDDSSDGGSRVVSLCTQDGFEGGSCLKLEACLTDPADVCLFDLFQMNVKVSESLIILLTWKTLGEGTDIFLDIKMEAEKSVRTVRLCPGKPCREESGCVMVEPLSRESLKDILHIQDVPEEGQHGWKTSCFQVNCHAGGEALRGVSVGLRVQDEGSRQVTALLGQIQVVPLSVCRQPLPEISKLSYHRCPATAVTSGDRLSDCGRGWLSWDVTSPELVDHYRVYLRGAGYPGGETDDRDLVLLGHSVSCVFCLPPLSSVGIMSPVTSTLLVTVQPMASSGFSLPLSSCHTIQLPKCSIPDT